MTARADARNDRIAMRYMFGENAKTLAVAYGLGLTRIRQIIRCQLEHSRRQFQRQFDVWPDDLAIDALRPRLLHLLNQWRVRTGLAPLPPELFIPKGMRERTRDTHGKREKASVCSTSVARGRQDVEAAAKRLDSPERRALDTEAA